MLRCSLSLLNLSRISNDKNVDFQLLLRAHSCHLSNGSLKQAPGFPGQLRLNVEKSHFLRSINVFHSTKEFVKWILVLLCSSRNKEKASILPTGILKSGLQPGLREEQMSRKIKIFPKHG